MAGTNILVRQKDLIAGSGISITPDTTSGNVTIAATNTAIDESRLLPTGGKGGDILSYQEGADRGNGDNVRLLLQNALTDSANGNAAPAAVTTQGVTLTGDNNLMFDGNDSHVTAVLATDEIFAADKEWTVDFWMKPTANSSEWNYILTETTGDWGSHSIGLTWNKSKSVLEQDTGGYVASVIKAPNWPNNSIACAVNEWHFVAVEKQKTATGWSLNYYLNGAIWLQVAFTGEFVPFSSDNPFWFGGKTTDGGRCFKGEANKLRVTAGARYGGKAFAVPDRLIDYAAPAGQPVWIEGIDRSRLLPENPASGDIPCYNATATTGGGNDANTRLLLQPSTSDHGIVDQAAGNAAPVTLENHNVTVDEEGNMVFDGGNAYLKIPANTLPSDFFNGTDEWTLDIVYNVASKSMQCLFGCSSSLRMDFLLDSNGSLQIGGGPNLGTGWPFNENVHLTFEIYKDGASWKYTIFRNGSVVTTGTWINADWRSVAQYVGWEGESNSRKINGKIKALRLTSGALHKGAAFQSDYPWTKPQTVGEWSKLNKSELVKSVNGQLPDESGNVTVETGSTVDESRLLPTGGRNGNLLEYQEGVDRGNNVNTKLLLQPATSDGLIVDQAAGNAAPVGITNSGNVAIAANALVFSGENALIIEPNTLGMTLGGNNEYSIEVDFQLDQVKSDWATLFGGDGNMTRSAFYINSSGATAVQGGIAPDTTGWTTGTRHRLTIERFQDGDSWKTVIYRNGAVLATSVTTPNTLSGDRFPIGSNLEGTGRNFVGKIWAFRISSKAEHRGVSFTPLELPFLPPAGQPVWTEGIDRSRLLPEDPANGDIPCYSNEPPVGVNYNDANTVLLLQGSSDNTAAAPTAERLNGIVTGEFPVQEDGSLLVNGTSNYITFNDADTRRVFSGEFTLETYIKTTQFTSSGARHDTNWCVVYRNDTSNVTAYQWLLLSDFFADAGKFGIWPYPQMSGETFPKTLINAEFQHVAIDVYMVDGVRKFTMYRNGVPYHTGNYWSTTPADWSSTVSAAMRLFGEGTSGGDDYLSNASVMSLRVSNIARYKGVSFDPPADGKYLTPPAGYWGKLNKNELVQSINGVTPDESGNVILDASTIIDNSRLLPVLDTLPEGYEGSLLAVKRGDGKVADENTLRLMHFNDDVRDVVTDETGTLKGNASITPTGYFAGALSINHAVVSSLSFNGLTATPAAWTMDFRVKLGRFSGDAPLILIGTNLNETQTSLIRVDSSYIDIQATYNQRVIYKTHSLQLDTWYHFALTYDGTTYKFYVDGKLFGSGESTNQFDFTRKLWFGSFYDYSTSYVSDCTIDEFRLSNVVRWTENFTPPDAPYGESLYNWGIGPKLDESRLLPETGSVSSDSVGNPVIFKAISRIDNTYWLCLPLNEDTNDRSTYGVATEIYGTVNIVSSAPSSPGGSAFFNGSSCLHGTLPAQFGSGDFTVRFWMMAPGMNSSTFPQTIFSIRQGNTTSGSTFALHCTTEGRLYVYSNTTITSNTDTPFTLQPSVWYHVAVVRKSGVLTIYVNGEVYNSATFTNSLTRQIFGLGASWTGSSYSEAGTVYLTSLDVLNYAAYDGAFTTPAYQPGTLAGMGYKVATDSEVTDMLSSAGIDKTRLLPANPSDYDLAIYRVFPEEAAPQNLTSATSDPNWEVTWSGAYSGRVGWWAFDSDQGTMWCTYSAAVGDWLCWEYKGTEGSVLLRRYSIAKGSGNGDCPTGWKIQGSNDGSTWVDLDEQNGQSFPDNNAKEYTIPNNSTPYKFHRFYLLSWNTSNMIGTFKAWSWINSTEERKVWIPINKSEFVVNDARLLPDAPSDTTNSYWLNSGPVATQVSPASYAGSTDATWKMELSGAFEDGDISTLFDSDTTNGVSGTLGLETFGTVRWIRKDQVPYRIDRIVLRAQNSDIGAFPKTIHLSGYDKSAFGPGIVQEFNAPVWETESDTSTYATSSFTRVCTLEVNAPAFQSYDYSIVLGSGSGLETTLQAFAAYQLDTETAWKQLNTATTTTAGLMAAADKVKLDALQQAATYINIATDFNTYKTAGSYFLKGAAHTNGPLTDSYAGTLVVVAPAELRYTTQYFTQLYTNKTFVRTYSRENSAWSAWNRVIVDTDLATTTMAGLMSATDREKSIGLTTRGFYPNALAKSGAVDFNEVIDHGFYFIGGDTPHLNYPETYQQNGGTLQVIRNGNYLTQTFIPLNINTVFIRTCVNALSDSSVRTFSAWRRALTAPDITESKARPGYFKLPGGTIVQWGKKTAITRDEENCYISFPIAFPTMFLSATAIASSGTLSATGVIVSLSEASTTSMTMVVKNHPNTGSPDMDQYIEMYWFAVGF